MWLVPGQGLTAIVQLTGYNLLGQGWDGLESTGQLFLLIRFPQVYRCDQEVPLDPDRQAVCDTIIGYESRELTEDEVQRDLWPQSEERVYALQGAVWETVVQGVEGYILRLLHGATVSVLLFRDPSATIRLPDL
jgi:hypothetical protein